MPGPSISSAPLGSPNSSRATVVWRPRPSPARTAWVAWRSRPSSALASVDLPAPETPSRTAVSPGASSRPSASRPLAASADSPPGSGRAGAGSRPARPPRSGTPRRGRARGPAAARPARGRRRGRPWSGPAAVARRRRWPARAGARRDAAFGSGNASTIRARSTLAASGCGRVRLADVVAHDRAAALEHVRDRAAAVEGDPVAGHGRAGVRVERARARRHERGALVGAGHQPASAVLREHAGGGEVVVCELLRARRSGQGAGRGQRAADALEVLHVFITQGRAKGDRAGPDRLLGRLGGGDVRCGLSCCIQQRTVARETRSLNPSERVLLQAREQPLQLGQLVLVEPDAQAARRSAARRRAGARKASRPASVSSTRWTRRLSGSRERVIRPSLVEPVEVVGERRPADAERLGELALGGPVPAHQREQDEPGGKRAAGLGERVLERAVEGAARAGDVHSDRF